jgi:hypothetical protein
MLKPHSLLRGRTLLRPAPAAAPPPPAGGAPPPHAGAAAPHAGAAATRGLARSRVVAMAQPWRPSPDDVDRLSRGEGAKRRGTGNHHIPHRLSLEERPVFESSKKRGFLAVRGAGARKAHARHGHPLPNSFRQWADARGVPCVVIEQDRSGAGLDTVVVDLAPLRLLDTSQV